MSSYQRIIHIFSKPLIRVLRILKLEKHLFSDKTRAQVAQLPPIVIKLFPGTVSPMFFRMRPRLMSTNIDREIWDHIVKLLEFGDYYSY